MMWENAHYIMLIEENGQQNYTYNMNLIYTHTHKDSTAEC